MAKILVIDDDPSVQQFARRTLAEARHLVTVAKDGGAGLRVLARWPADLVIMDIFIPDQDGLQTLCEIQHNYPGMKIIAMSDRRRMGSVVALDMASKLGADQVLRKPFTEGGLLACIGQCLAVP